MRFVQDGEDAACLASVQVSTPQPDEVAEPAHWAYIARAVTVVADGWAHAIPVPTGLWRYQEARSLARENRRQAIEGGLRLGRTRR